jgi:serine protease Do
VVPHFAVLIPLPSSLRNILKLAYYSTGIQKLNSVRSLSMKSGLFKVLGLFLILGVQSGSSLAQGLPDFTGLVEKNAPAIVNVSTTLEIRQIADEDRESLEELLRYLEDRVPQLELPQPAPDSEQPNATGSGFIISDDGLHSDKSPCHRKRKNDNCDFK